MILMTMRSRQKDFERIGAEGCYFLSIVRAAERLHARYIDAYLAYIHALETQLIEEDCFVNDPAGLLGNLTEGKWSVTKEPADYKAKPGEIVILRYERKEPTKTWAHFVLASTDGSKVEYDPYGGSKTVKDGVLVSKRVFSRL